jgi:Dyp-type peroxidase family
VKAPAELPDDQLDDIQSLAITSWKRLQHGAYLFVTFPADRGVPAIAARRAWLRGLIDKVSRASEVTPRDTDEAVARKGGDPRLQIAFTPDGLAALGATEAEREGLSQEVTDGMARRARFLGDGEHLAWELGGPEAPRIGAMLACFAGTHGELEDIVAERTREITALGATCVAEPSTWIGTREHFGYADGISQPIIARKRAREVDPNHVVPAGEILLGYENAYGRVGNGPRATRPDGTVVDLGKNGTYLVFRKLEQHVTEFWSYFREQAIALLDSGVGPGRDCTAAEMDAWIDWLAAKSIGRWRSGAPLVLTPDHEDPAKAGASVVNKFDFRELDLRGDRCPIGSHIRRANPRDAREPDTSTVEESRKVIRRHRVLRRGRSWGAPMDRQDAINGVRDGVRRGLLFICLQASIARGFEFVQQTWLSNLGFGGLSRESDPLAKGEVDPRGSPHDGFTIPCHPLRLRLHGMPRFVTTCGGDYFFLPSMTALRYFAG